MQGHSVHPKAHPWRLHRYGCDKGMAMCRILHRSDKQNLDSFEVRDAVSISSSSALVECLHLRCHRRAEKHERDHRPVSRRFPPANSSPDWPSSMAMRLPAAGSGEDQTSLVFPPCHTYPIQWQAIRVYKCAPSVILPNKQAPVHILSHTPTSPSLPQACFS